MRRRGNIAARQIDLNFHAITQETNARIQLLVGEQAIDCDVSMPVRNEAGLPAEVRRRPSTVDVDLHKSLEIQVSRGVFLVRDVHPCTIAPPAFQPRGWLTKQTHRFHRPSGHALEIALEVTDVLPCWGMLRGRQIRDDNVHMRGERVLHRCRRAFGHCENHKPMT